MLWLLKTRLRNRVRSALGPALAIIVIGGVLAVRGGTSSTALSIAPWPHLLALVAGVACIAGALVRVPAFSRSHDDMLLLAGRSVGARAFVGVAERSASRLRGLVLVALLAAVAGNSVILLLAAAIALTFEVFYGTARIANTAAALLQPRRVGLALLAELVLGATAIAMTVVTGWTKHRFSYRTIFDLTDVSAWSRVGFASACGLLAALVYVFVATQVSAIGVRGAATIGALQLKRTTRMPATRASLAALFVAAAVIRTIGDPSAAMMLAALLAGCTYMASMLTSSPWHRWYTLPLCLNAQPRPFAATCSLIVVEVAAWTVPIVVACTLAAFPGGIIAACLLGLGCAANRVVCFGAESITSDATFIGPIVKVLTSAAGLALVFWLYGTLGTLLFITSVVTLFTIASFAAAVLVERRLSTLA
jgi:hypothetical protein